MPTPLVPLIYPPHTHTLPKKSAKLLLFCLVSFHHCIKSLLFPGESAEDLSEAGQGRFQFFLQSNFASSTPPLPLLLIDFSCYVIQNSGEVGLMENGHGYGHYRGSGLWRTLQDDEYEESDVWGVLNDREECKDDTAAFHYDEREGEIESEPASLRKGVPIPPSGSGSMAHRSAPVNISCWPSRVSSSGKKKETRDDSENDGDGGSDEEEEEEGEGEDGFDHRRLPPHEYIAMRLARSHISSFSVLEGAGRKLKGRDLSKVRNAVLTKTGFL